LRNIFIQKVKEGAVFGNQHWNAKNKMPLFIFMMKSQHAQKHAGASEKSSHEKKHSFRNSFRAIFSGSVFVDKHYQKCQQINHQKKYKYTNENIVHILVDNFS